jgi:hypothetical protein
MRFQFDKLDHLSCPPYCTFVKEQDDVMDAYLPVKLDTFHCLWHKAVELELHEYGGVRLCWILIIVLITVAILRPGHVRDLLPH